MNAFQRRFPGFQTSISSVMAAFFLVGAVDAIITGIRYPISSGVSASLRWLATKIPSDVIIDQMDPAWEVCAMGLVSGIVFLLLAFLVARWNGSGNDRQ